MHCSAARNSARFALLLVALSVSLAATVALAADEYSAKRRKLDDEFRSRLEELAAKCDELKMTEQARVTRGWFISRDPGRQYIFLPADADPVKPPESAPDLVEYWHRKFREHRDAQANALFDLANKSLEADDPARAYQLLHEVLRENPDHEEARRILGYTFDRTRKRWRRPGTEPTSRRIRVAHQYLDRKSGGYWRVETEHFEIATDHSAREGLELGRRLETLYEVWQQVFFRHWSNDAVLAAWFKGPGSVRRDGKKHRIVLFRDRDEYVEVLGKLIPGIEVSQGIYVDEQETSFMYAGDPSAETTWLHEATHQLFQENGRVAPKVGREDSAWLIEGIAMYMESLAEYDGYCTVGGFDADRLQFARYRAANEQFYVPLDELVRFGRDALQRDERRGKLYSQSAGLAHFLMDGNGAKYRQAAVDYLRAIYAGAETRGALAEATGTTHESLDKEYHLFLNVTDEDLLKHMRPAEQVAKLSLGHTAVGDEGLATLKGCVNLDWLDLAHTKTTDAGIAHLAAATKLTQLNLESTSVTDAGLAALAGLKQLEILDLSNTAITDDGLARLGGLTNLKELWLRGSRITDDGLIHLRNLKHLETLDASGTGVTADGLAQLKRSLPKLKN